MARGIEAMSREYTDISWMEVATTLAVMGIITFLLLR
jgi:hypothetical protein